MALVSNAEHPNVSAYWRMIRAFNENDLEMVATLLDADLVYTIPGRSPIAGTVRGLPAHLAQLKRARELSANTLRLEPQEVVASGDYVFVFGRVSARRGDRNLDSEHLVMFRFANGKIVEGRTVPVDLYEFDSFWS